MSQNPSSNHFLDDVKPLLLWLFIVTKPLEIGYDGVMRTKEHDAQKKHDWYLSHRKESIDRTLQWRKDNPDGRRKHRRTARGVKNATGETKTAPCEICLRIMQLQLDHDHETGKQRGWLCGRCNKALGWWEQILAEGLDLQFKAYVTK